jgi:hypothetical protein
MNSKKTPKRSMKPSVPTIKCTCGHKILLLPDAKEMGQVIEEHAREDKRKYSLSQEETNDLMDNLILQAFTLAQDNSKNKNKCDSNETS